MTSKSKGLAALISAGESEEIEIRHVDNFIGYGNCNSDERYETYARWVLDYFRGSAVCKNDFHEFMKDNLLFCDFEGSKYRVIGASRLGDVWLTSDFKSEQGYQHRVCVDSCTNWQKI